MMEKGSFEVKIGLAEMLKGGVIMDVTTAEQAKIAEEAGAVAVMALERIPADIREAGGIARMSSPRGASTSATMVRSNASSNWPSDKPSRSAIGLLCPIRL